VKQDVAIKIFQRWENVHFKNIWSLLLRSLQAKCSWCHTEI